MLKLDPVKQDLQPKRDSLVEIGDSLEIPELKKESEELNKKTLADDFWNDSEAAQKVLQQKKQIDDKIKEYESLLGEFDDLEEMIELCEEMESEGEAEEADAEADDIITGFDDLKKKLDNFRIAMLLNGKYDSKNALLSVHAGAGGVDAMDWTEMLLRMYTRWAENHGYKVDVVDVQDDTEAGIKSATFFIEGMNAYGYLKHEKGVHRLVRISPFNAAGKRQTSFAALEVMPEMDDVDDVEIKPEDLRIDTYRSSGAGGQHVNKTDSAIRITHLPTNIVVTCQNERSQHQNKDMAMKILISRLADLDPLLRLPALYNGKGSQDRC